MVVYNSSIGRDWTSTYTNRQQNLNCRYKHLYERREGSLANSLKELFVALFSDEVRILSS